MLPALFVSYLMCLIAVPAAIKVARRTDFMDRPRSYKQHARPTPYLGGAAVLTGVVAGALASLSTHEFQFGALLAGAILLWAVGTTDDRVALGPRVRVLAEILAAMLLWRAGLGWDLFGSDAADLLVTILWVVGIVNAFNLMDNLDGAAATVAGVSAAGIALLSSQDGPASLTALALAVTGACAAFLRYNLAKPARIFLGDGGSMPLGFLLAGLSMAVWRKAGMDGIEFLPMILLVGLPVLDMTLVIISRLRRSAPVGKGGRDHITHRLYAKLGSTRAVAAILAVSQALLCVAAIRITELQAEGILVASAVAFALGLITITILETPWLAPEAAGVGDQRGWWRGGRTSWDERSTSRPLSEGATSGRSAPRTEP